MAARPCLIFISHSAHAHEEPQTQRFLNELIAAIEQVDGLQALADQRDLDAGDDWMQRLFAWMGLCDAAVVLLSPRAVKRENSTWVPRETNLLLWRRKLDPDFVLVPVFVGDLRHEDLRANAFLADVRLADLQFPKASSEPEMIALIVDALKSKLAAKRARRIFDPVRVHIEDCLESYAPSGSIDHALSRHVGDSGWQPNVEPHQKLAVELLRRAASNEVDPVIGDVVLGSQGKHRLGALLFESLYPMRLPAESACRLLTLCLEQEGKGCVLVNAQDAWVVGMLLRAATGLPKDDLLRTWEIVSLPNDWGDNDLAEVQAMLAESLAKRLLGTGSWARLTSLFGPDPNLSIRMAELNKRLAAARKLRQAPIIVCAAFTPRWLDLAAALVRQLPTTVFVFWTGDALPEPSTPDRDDCVALRPPWPARDDWVWLDQYRMTLQHFGGDPA
jgi:TIR domain